LLNKLITPEEMKAYVRSTWKKCQAEAQGDGEPVAIGWYIEGFSCVLGPIRPEVRYEEWRPFYAIRKPQAQRKPWVGLTDEDFNSDMFSITSLGVCDIATIKSIAKDVEAKLREKNA